MEETGRVIALLIDAENISPRYIDVILDELSGYGTPAYKRIYGDWTAPDMASWKKLLLQHNLTPIQQFSYTQGKNASDSSMIIDAMDILYSKNCDGFCLVSSDSDFTRLASRLRESRMFVIGMGESKTPMSFKSACDTFKYLDVLQNAKKQSAHPGEEGGRAKNSRKPARPKAAKGKPAEAEAAAAAAGIHTPEPAMPEAAPAADLHDDVASGFVPLEEIIGRIHDIIDKDSDEDGYMSLSEVGSILGRLHADFDTRNYGFSKLHKLIDYAGEFETKFSTIPGGGRNLLVRNK